ncbi:MULTISPECIES: hypothetical protein [Burkholderiaceae]|uniref:hypothetical protein n=1 Tax=Burkholderiaceae TaxID=119060 RepID=UPI001420FF23|nr:MULTISPECIES: hypothetical protein [Burkholderiaceae]MBN3846749.1 hypothetical protein [Paraburkholderia sp. Ac-20342]NIF51243.1 hypothetical protein [Burkholderia sp. Ax-1724]
MDLRSIILCFACLSLAASGFIFGAKFIKKKNYLLGLEWFILATSSTNFLFFNITGSPALYKIAHFFDAFSRGFGVPVVGVAGLMAVTHNYKPSVRQDILLFAISIIGTIFIVNFDFLTEPLPYFYLVMWGAMMIYLCCIVKRLFEIGEAFNAVMLMLGIVSSSIIAGIYDFYKIPGEDTNVVFNFFTLALLTWAYFAVAIYYSYCALERGQGRWTAVAA